LPALEPSRIFFVHPDELDQIVDSEVGEGLDTVFPDAIDPHDTVRDLHFVGDVPELDAGRRGDMLRRYNQRVSLDVLLLLLFSYSGTPDLSAT
jgi:hypothetical protein